jgi:UDP-2-acetamido-3-amino-2,3-dideoxy-glucuronate N-acetyltransferase
MKQGKNCKIWHPELSTLLDCSVGDDCTIHSHVWIGNNVVIGNRCKIQAFAFIPDGVVIHDDVFIGPGVVFTNDLYPPSDGWLATTVKKGASIGARSVILPGIIIGQNAVIGAGSVVTRNVPDEALVYGPAAGIRT